jgi:hypothetical protein
LVGEELVEHHLGRQGICQDRAIRVQERCGYLRNCDGGILRIRLTENLGSIAYGETVGLFAKLKARSVPLLTISVKL